MAEALGHGRRDPCLHRRERGEAEDQDLGARNPRIPRGAALTPFGPISIITPLRAGLEAVWTKSALSRASACRSSTSSPERGLILSQAPSESATRSGSSPRPTDPPTRGGWRRRLWQRWRGGSFRFEGTA